MLQMSLHSLHGCFPDNIEMCCTLRYKSPFSVLCVTEFGYQIVHLLSLCELLDHVTYLLLKGRIYRFHSSN